jgi:hypothetical protein
MRNDANRHSARSAPAGAVQVDEWNGDGPDRGRYFEHAPINIVDVALTIHGIQYARGTTGRSIKIRLDEALQREDMADDLTPRDARRLAAMLQNLADTCEILDGV